MELLKLVKFVMVEEKAIKVLNGSIQINLRYSLILRESAS